MSTANSTLAKTLLPTKSIASDIGLVVGGAALTALAAWQIPWQPVPFTLQSLAVMLVGLSLGAKRGMLSQLTYLAAGLAGAPIFAGFVGGPGKLIGPTGGYLVAFVVTAGLLGWMSDRGWTKTLLGSALALAAGSLVTLVIGTLWLGTSIGLQKAVLVGFVPFIGIEAVKAAIAIPILPIAWRYVRR